MMRRFVRILLLVSLMLMMGVRPAFSADGGGISTASFWSGTTAAAALLVAVGAVVWKNASLAGVYIPEQGSLLGKNIVVTGANTGLGLESAKRLALGGANVILNVRSDAKGEQAVKDVRSYLQERDVTYENQNIIYYILHLDSLTSIRDAITDGWGKELPEIHVVMNNAAVVALPRLELTEDGLERQFQVNHLGHFLLLALIRDKLAPDCRIINVSSEAYRFTFGLDWDYVWKAKKGYNGWKSYAQSKLANILFTHELQRLVEEEQQEALVQWTVVSLHPGEIATDAMRNIFKFRPRAQRILDSLIRGLAQLGLLQTVETGATTQVWLAAAANHNIDGGAYYVNAKPRRKLPSFATNQTDAKRLWRESEAYAGIRFLLPTSVSQQRTE